MGRTKAMAMAREERMTWGELKAYLAKADPFDKPVLNAAVGRARTLEILLAAANEREDTEIPKAWTRDPYTGRDKPSRDFPLVCNILREAL